MQAEQSQMSGEFFGSWRKDSSASPSIKNSRRASKAVQNNTETSNYIEPITEEIRGQSSEHPRKRNILIKKMPSNEALLSNGESASKEPLSGGQQFRALRAMNVVMDAPLSPTVIKNTTQGLGFQKPNVAVDDQDFMG